MRSETRFPFVVLLLFSSATMCFAQPSERKNTPQDYIDKYKDDAIREMQLWKVPASITLAQGMLESDNGNSALAVYANNHFGIKCHNDWTGDTYTANDDTANECFRKYASVYDSYVDHSKFLKGRDRYAFLFDLKITDYKGWANGLKQAGYATDPKYASRLIHIIELYKLYEFDKQNGLPPAGVTVKNPAGANVSTTVTRREIYTNNNVKYVIVREGDSFVKIARELDMGVWQLHKYNELGKDATLKPGMMLYIQPKRRHSIDTDTHTVKPGETMYDIAQQYGMKVSALYKINGMAPGTQPGTGDVLRLKKSRRK